MLRRWCDTSILTPCDGLSLTRSSLPMSSAPAFNSAHDCEGVAATALVIAEPVLSKVISPEALSEFLSTGWPVRVVPEVPPGTIGISRKDLVNAWQVFAASEYGFARYSISLPQSVSPTYRFTLTFKLLRWHRELTSITLPESIQNLLA